MEAVDSRPGPGDEAPKAGWTSGVALMRRGGQPDGAVGWGAGQGEAMSFGLVEPASLQARELAARWGRR